MDSLPSTYVCGLDNYLSTSPTYHSSLYGSGTSEEERKMKCRFCREELDTITWTHLKYRHDNMTVAEYEALPGYTPIRSPGCCEGISRGVNLAYEKDSTYADRIASSLLGNPRRSHTEEAKQRMREGHRRSFEEDPTLKGRLLQNFGGAIVALRYRVPNKPESTLIEMLESRFPGQFRLNVDGNQSNLVYSWGYRGTKSPDIVRIDGIRQVIFSNGNYWHRDDSEEKLVEGFRKVGIDCIVIWADGWEDIVVDWPRIVERLKEGL